MKYLVDGWNNFCRVFEVPEVYPEGFLFAGGKPVGFLMVDWFNPISGLPQPAVSKEEWQRKVGEIESKTLSYKDLENKVMPFLLTKKYVVPGKKYLVLFDFGAAVQFCCDTEILTGAK